MCVIMTDEYEKNASQKTAKFLKQPRTLSLAIVPGEHIVSIFLAKEQQSTTPLSITEGTPDSITEGTPDSITEGTP